MNVTDNTTGTVLSHADLMADIDLFLSDLAATEEHSAHDSHMHGHMHNAHTQEHMMQMWFHGGWHEVILFHCWRINSFTGLLLSCVCIFVMAALYEGIKWFRVYLQINSYPNCHRHDVQKRLLEEGKSNGGGDAYTPTTTPPLNCHPPPTQMRQPQLPLSPFHPMRLVQGSLYLVQLTLAYWLMLVVMTYNSWLSLAVVLGAAFGHWLFAVLNCLDPRADRLDSFATDACH